MRQLRLANTDLDVSALCLGTNQLGTSLDDDAASALLAAFKSAGGNFLDTAHSYGDWVPSAPRSASEHCLGRWLRTQRREDWIIATKGCEFDYRAGFDLRVTPKHLNDDLRGSLDALGIATIDLYWLHRDDPSKPVEAILDALIQHQQAGRIRYFGCSNWSVARIQQAQAYAKRIGHVGFVACQPMWGLAEPDRTALQQFSPGGYYEDGYRALHREGLSMIPYSGQSRGFFSKLAADAAMGDDIKALFLNERNRRKLPILKAVAERHGASLNAVVLGYLLCQPYPTIPIIGCRGPEQLQESLEALSVNLTEQDLTALRDA